MIKRLRLKFTCISMCLITALLAVILVMICRFTWVRMETRSITILQSAADDMLPSGGNHVPGGLVRPNTQPYFIMYRGPDGKLEATSRNTYYDLSDTALLQQIFHSAIQTGKRTGVLWDHSLRFYRLDLESGQRYAFIDISSEITTIRTLVISCAGFGIGAFLLFFVLMWSLSRWMVRPVEEAWTKQRQFVADASHELKTPLTVIITNAELLQNEDYSPQDQKRFVKSIHTMSQQMRGLVESLLELARIDNGVAHLQLGRIDLSSVVEQATLPFEAVYFEAGKTLDSNIAPGIFLHGSEAYLGQVVEILLDNGCKYALPGSTVTLTLQSTLSGKAQLTVTSQGEHLTAQQCQDIFKRFYRVDEARAMNHSYGLGLPIAKSIVEVHNGKIWCESKDGTNTFFVTLPV